MRRYLDLILPLRRRPSGAATNEPGVCANSSQDSRTCDGADIWQANALFSATKQLAATDAPLRVVLLEDYESLLRLLARTTDHLKSMHSATDEGWGETQPMGLMSATDVLVEAESSFNSVFGPSPDELPTLDAHILPRKSILK